jgi:hypothetical protein
MTLSGKNSRALVGLRGDRRGLTRMWGLSELAWYF